MVGVTTPLPRLAIQIRCQSQASQPDARKVVVVGGGAGGLVTAGRLARAGCSVTLLEKNSEVGGRLQSMTVDGFRFDTGPSLLLFPDKYAEAFAALGSPMEDCLDVRRVEPAAYRVHFMGDSPSCIDLTYDVDQMAASVERMEAGAGEQYRRFLTMARRHLDLGVPNFIDRDFTSLQDAAGLQDLLPSLSSVNPWQLLGPHDRVMKGFFRDPRLRAMTTFQDLYVGLTPKSAPAVFSLLAGSELTDGIWYPMGGFQKVRDALLKAVERCGVTVRTDAAVTSINVDASSAVAGVTLAGGEVLQAEVVVCNRDLPAAYELLQGAGPDTRDSSGNAAAIEAHAQRRSEQLGRLQYSAGVIAFNWGIEGRLEGLAHHNTFLSDEFERSWQLVGSPEALPHRPNFYVHAPARTDPSAAPEGCDSIMVLLPVACMQQQERGSRASSSGPPTGDYSALVDAGRQRVLQAFTEAGLGDVGAMIRTEVVIAPPQWEERYGLKYGAAFGLSHGLDQLSLFRPGNKDSEVGGLYFVGASTRPGNGVPLCFISGKLTAQRILKDLGMPSPSVTPA